MPKYVDVDMLRREYEKSLMNDKHTTEEASAIHKQEHRHILHILDKCPTVFIGIDLANGQDKTGGKDDRVQ